MWFHPDWAAALGGTLVELGPVGAMLERAGRALRFSPAASETARKKIGTLFLAAPEARVLHLLELLALLATDDTATPLATSPATIPAGTDRTRIDRVLDHIHLNYAARLGLPELADIAALSESGLHRLFRRHTRQTVTGYVTALRIGEACALLSGTSRPVAHIADDVGYESLPNFNRQFKALKAMTPRAYREKFARR
jgi:AraC-like DNA-binding protein